MKADTLGEAPTNPLAINRDTAHGRTADGLSLCLIGNASGQDTFTTK
jgi:hypothetical protein